MKGFVTINKVFKDGTVESVLDRDENILTDGFGIAVVNLFSVASENVADDLQIGYFQLGTSSYSDDPDWTDSLPSSVANNFYSLSAPLPEPRYYGPETTIDSVYRNVITVTNPFEEASALNYTYENQAVCRFENDSVSKISDRYISCKFTIDDKGAPNQQIKEFGLFIKNPEGHQDIDRPVLAAYKLLPEPLVKNDEFSIDVEWLIDVSNED